uniref:Metalloendopeptidase n=1 Tax=Heligmosomoides polygyrus TaxID=6339 RepID=A0A183FIP3_HELPZ
LKYISARTCIDFTENATARNRVRVFSGSGCYSKLGMLGNEQDLSLMGSCASVGLAAHEFMHALGVLHMHSREDRDNFLKVDLSSVDQGLVPQFEKIEPGLSINYTPFEYGSVMHYAANL